MNDDQNMKPKSDWLFELVAKLSGFQLHARLRSAGSDKKSRLLFAITMGVAAVGTITAAAVITDLPLLFPPLAPSAFILFTTPLAPTAAPRSVILGHLSAALMGLLAVIIVSIAIPGADLGDPTIMNGPRIIAIVLAMGLATTTMLVLRCSHPPAAATALLAAMGLIHDPVVMAALEASAILLCVEAYVLLRVVGGLPYPLWSPDHDMARFYGTLAGGGETKSSGWERVHAELLAQHEDLPSDDHDHINEDRTEVYS
mgnify:CR=1 FL=1